MKLLACVLASLPTALAELMPQTFAMEMLSFSPPNGTGYSAADMPVINIAGPLAQDCCSKYRSIALQYRRAYELYFEWLHQARGGITIGGVKHRVALTLYDDGSSHQRVEHIMRHLIHERGIHLLLGPYSSGLSNTASRIVNESNVSLVLMNPAASNPKVYFDRPRVFGSFPPAPTLFVSAFDAMKGKCKTVASFYEAASYTRSSCGSVPAQASRVNMIVVGQFEISANANSTEVGNIVAKMAALKPDLVVGCTYYNTCKRFLEQAALQKYSPRAMVFQVCVTMAQFLPELADAAEYVLGASPWTPSMPYLSPASGYSAHDFDTMFRSRFGAAATPYQATSAWACLESYVSAIEQADSTDPQKVADALRQQSLDTFFGTVKYNEHGQNQNPFKVVQVQRKHHQLKTYLVAPANDANENISFPIPTWNDRECLKGAAVASMFGMVDGSCVPCPTGKVSYVPNASNYSLQVFRECASCPTGKVPTQFTDAVIFCISCSSGKFSQDANDLACVACPVGKFQDKDGETECEECHIGSAANTQGAVICKECHAGSFADAPGTARCSECAPGRYQNEEKQSFCERCPEGYAAAAAGSVLCEKCEAGKARNSTADSTKCSECAMGRYSGVGQTNCTSCSRGKHADSPGTMYQCTECPKGRFVDYVDATSCDRCNVNTYIDSKGQTACKSCPGDLATHVGGAESYDECQCAPEYYRPAKAPTTCAKCVKGLRCDQWNSLPTVLEGFMVEPGAAELVWHSTQSSTSRRLNATDSTMDLAVYSCLSKSVCKGSRPLPATGDWSTICDAGRIGIACVVCPPEYYVSGSRCIDCKAGGTIASHFPEWTQVIGLMVVTSVVVHAMYIRFNMAATVIDLSFGMAIKFIQTFAVLDKYQVDWPTLISSVMVASKSIKVDIGFIGFPRWGCLLGFSFQARYLQSMTHPVLIFLVFVGNWLWSQTLHRIAPRRYKNLRHECPSYLEFQKTMMDQAASKGTTRGRKRAWTRHACQSCAYYFDLYNWVVLFTECKLPPHPMMWNKMFNSCCKLVNGLYIALTSLAISLFRCEEHPSGMNALVSYPDVECGGSDWIQMLVVGIAGLCFYSFGFFAMVLYQTLRAPRAFIEDKQFKVKYKFMLGKFQPDKWWFSCVGLVQALLLNVISTFGRNSYVQLYLTIVLYMLFASLQCVFWPWKFHQVNVIDIVCKISILLILILGTSVVKATDTEREDSVAVFKYLMLVFMCSPLLYILGVVIRTIYLGCFTNKAARDIAFTQNFHNIMLLAGFRTNQELHRFISTLPDKDYRVCQSFVNLMFAQMFKLQPGHKITQQRLIPNASHFHVATSKGLVRRLARLQEQGYQVGPAFEERHLLLKLAIDLTKASDTDSHLQATTVGKRRGSLSTDLLQFAPLRSESPIASIMPGSKMVEMLKLSSDKEMSCDEFVSTVSPVIQALSADEVARVFNLIDIDQSGTVSLKEFTTLLDGVVASTGTSEGENVAMLGFVTDNSLVLKRFTLHVWRAVAHGLVMRRELTRRRLKAMEVKERFGLHLTSEQAAAVRIARFMRRVRRRRQENKQKACAIIIDTPALHRQDTDVPLDGDDDIPLLGWRSTKPPPPAFPLSPRRFIGINPDAM